MESYNLFENHNNQHALAKANINKMYGVKEPEQRTDILKANAEVMGNMLEKGEISDALASGYGPGSQAMVFVKTGKEIKEKAPEILAALAVQKGTVEAQLTMFQEASGIAPSNTTSRRYDKNVPFMRYEWALCEPKYLGDGNYEEKTDQMGMCNKYNSLIYIYCDILDDIDAINIITKNVEDSKKYSLSVSQLIALNFK